MAIVTQATKFKVPREDNSVLIWATAPLVELLRANRAVRANYPAWLGELSDQSRRELAPLLVAQRERRVCCSSCASQTEAISQPLEEASEPGMLDPSSFQEVCPSDFWILGGHQPELFHPGVWFKNVYLDRAVQELARQGEPAIGLHLIVDHDLARSTSLRSSRIVDGRLLQASHIMPIANASAAPWEATYYNPSDREAWERWLDDVIEDCESLGISPILKTRRREFLSLLQESESIAEAFSRFRHFIEESNGIDNHELPMSLVARTRSFGEFLRRCLLDAHKFVGIYNLARDQFRQERGITNPAQPVPPLVRHGEWFELPFWIYGQDSRPVHRYKLWGRVLPNDAIELAGAPDSQGSFVFRLDQQGWQEDWERSIQAGICLRPRALTNTLFLRYVVADLFVHGIGGGIYDAVTDAIASRMWGLEPLAMQVVSAALYLPVAEHAAASLPAVIQVRPEVHRRDLQRLRSSPESFLDAAVPAEAELQTLHEQLLSLRPAKGQRKAWHWEMKKLREVIRTAIQPRIEQMQWVTRGLAEQERQNRIARSRESSFVLFPEEDIMRRLDELLPVGSAERLSPPVIS